MKTETKFVALLDRMTCIPCLAMRYTAENIGERAMFKRHGFGRSPDDRYTFFYLPNFGTCSYDPNKLGDDYTAGTCCSYMRDHWEEIESGSVLDAEYLRGEKDEPKSWGNEYALDMIEVLE